MVEPTMFLCRLCRVTLCANTNQPWLIFPKDISIPPGPKLGTDAPVHQRWQLVASWAWCFSTFFPSFRNRLQLVFQDVILGTLFYIPIIVGDVNPIPLVRSQSKWKRTAEIEVICLCPKMEGLHRNYGDEMWNKWCSKLPNCVIFLGFPPFLPFFHKNTHQ